MNALLSSSLIIAITGSRLRPSGIGVTFLSDMIDFLDRNSSHTLKWGKFNANPRSSNIRRPVSFLC